MTVGEHVITLRLEEHLTQPSFVHNSENLGKRNGGAADVRRLCIFCQASYQSIRAEEWNEMHEKLKDISNTVGTANNRSDSRRIGEGCHG